MNAHEFRQNGHQIIDWIANYLEHADQYPVMARTTPGEISQGLPPTAPEDGEDMARIFADFERDILPGVTHWNHPRFFAYFPANNSGPSILGELLAAGLGVNAMLWQTSPAATELEERVMSWLAQLVGLPDGFSGVIQDTASTATLCALLCARERTTGHKVNERGVATVGTTGCTAVDPLPAIGPIARRHHLWLHVDAALAGTAAILPDMRWIFDGVAMADSLVFNPHKWMFTNFDCSAYFVRDPEHLERPP